MSEERSCNPRSPQAARVPGAVGSELRCARHAERSYRTSKVTNGLKLRNGIGKLLK